MSRGVAYFAKTFYRRTVHNAQCVLPPIQRLSVLYVWQTSVHNQAIIIAAATQQPSFPTSHLKWKHRAHVVLGHTVTYSLFEEKIISQPPKVHIWNDQVSVSLIFSQVLLVTSFINLHRQGPQCWQRPFQAWHRSIPWSLIDQSRVNTWPFTWCSMICYLGIMSHQSREKAKQNAELSVEVWVELRYKDRRI